jgi:hypothetical protein
MSQENLTMSSGHRAAPEYFLSLNGKLFNIIVNRYMAAGTYVTK